MKPSVQSNFRPKPASSTLCTSARSGASLLAALLCAMQPAVSSAQVPSEGPAASATAQGDVVPGERASAEAASREAASREAGAGSEAGATSEGAAASPSGASASLDELLRTVGVAGGLTSEQAGRRAAESSREAVVKRYDVIAASEESRKTYYSLLPRVTATARYTRLSEVPLPSFGSADALSVVTPDGPGVLPAGATLIGVDTSFSFPIPLNNYFLNLGVTIPLSDYVLSTTNAMRGTKALKEGAELQERAVRLDAAAQARLAYYNWVRSRLQTVVAKQSLGQARAQLERTQLYYSAGRVAEADVMQAQAFAAEAELFVARAETASSINEQRLRTFMHADGAEPLEIGEDVTLDVDYASREHALQTASLDELYREAVSKRLEIRALDRSEYSLSRASAVQDTRRFPRVEAFGNVTYANPNQRVFPLEEEWRATWDVGVQLVWTINDLGIMDADARKTDAERAQIMAQKHALQDALRVELLSAQGAMREAALAAKTAEHGHAAAESALAARERLYAGGRATNLELIQAQTARLQARLNVVEAHIALRVAHVQLEHALGRDAAQLPR